MAARQTPQAMKHISTSKPQWKLCAAVNVVTGSYEVDVQVWGGAAIIFRDYKSLGKEEWTSPGTPCFSTHFSIWKQWLGGSKFPGKVTFVISNRMWAGTATADKFKHPNILDEISQYSSDSESIGSRTCLTCFSSYNSIIYSSVSKLSNSDLTVQ